MFLLGKQLLAYNKEASVLAHSIIEQTSQPLLYTYQGRLPSAFRSIGMEGRDFVELYSRGTTSSIRPIEHVTEVYAQSYSVLVLSVVSVLVVLLVLVVVMISRDSQSISMQRSSSVLNI